MTKPIDPYSRVYWRVAEDERFETIFGNDQHFAAWVRLLMLADAMYPTVAPLPATARKASIRALADAGLIHLFPGGLYRVHGLKAERDRRGPQRDPDRTPKGPAPEPDGTLARAVSQAKPSQAENETSRDALSTVRAPDPADVYWTLTGKYPNDKALSWIDDLSSTYGPESVIKALASTHIADRNSATLIGRAQDVLRSEARALSLNAQATVRQRLKEQRSAPRETVDPAAVQAEVQKILRGEAA